MKTLTLFGRLTLGVVMLLSFSIGAVQAGPCELPKLNLDNFNNSSNIINNPYFPLVPGTIFVYEPVPNEDDVVNTITVTYDIKTILGVNCIVVYDEETVGREVTERTYDWYAQDKNGNVWYFGEATESLQPDGSWSTEGSWEAGKEDALPGYLILAKPRPGVCYQQESAEDAQDTAKVLRLNAKVSVEYGDFKHCLVTKEWTPLEPGNIEQKFYAPGIGLVLIEELKGKTVRVELISISPPPLP